MYLVDENGRPVTSTPNTAITENDFVHYDTFEEWCAKSVITTNRAAWNYKDQQYKELAKCFEKAVAMEVMNKNKGIVETLKAKNKDIADLHEFCQTNIGIIQKLEMKLGELGITVDLEEITKEVENEKSS